MQGLTACRSALFYPYDTTRRLFCQAARPSKNRRGGPKSGVRRGGLLISGCRAAYTNSDTMNRMMMMVTPITAVMPVWHL